MDYRYTGDFEIIFIPLPLQDTMERRNISIPSQKKKKKKVFYCPEFLLFT